jgi:molybdopterin-guanine dinucleotide biosynthesis protein A
VTISIFDSVPGGLSGLVYIDADGDGVQDANELVLGGIRIHLTGTTSDGESIDLEMLTSDQGLYEFTDLQSGFYTVTQTQPRFLVDGGFQGAAPDITFSSNSYSVELAEGQEISDGDFTEKGREASTLTLFDFFNRPAPPTLIGSFGGTVAEQWIAAHPAWVDFQETSVTWDGGSHTMVVDVVRDDASTDYGVLTPEHDEGIRQVTDEADTAVIFVTGLPDTYGIESQAADDGGGGIPESEKVPNFNLEDVNATSTLFGTNVSPRDYDGNVTAFYFGLATCNYCTAQFGHLNAMQNDFDTNDPNLGIEIVGINQAGRESGNSSVTAGNNIPWLQDVDLDQNGKADAWEDWQAQLRDVIIVNAQNEEVSKINLTPNDLADAANYALLRSMITDAIAAVNDSPTINQPSDLALLEDAVTQLVSLAGITAGVSETQPLTVTATSNNPTLIADPLVTYVSDQSTGSLSLTPLTDQSGTATITVTVTDGGLDELLSTTEDNASFTTTFDVIVSAVNDSPTINQPSDLALLEDAVTQLVSLAGITAGVSETQPLTVTATSNNPTLIADPLVTYVSDQSTGLLSLMPLTDQSGTATITVTVTDGGLDELLSTTEDNALFTTTFDVIVSAESEAEAELTEATVTAVQDAIDTIAEAQSAEPTETVTAHDLALSSWF